MIYSYIYIYIIVIYVIHNGPLSIWNSIVNSLESRLGTTWQLRSCWQLLAQAHGGSSFINDEWLTTMFF